jgi:chemotaxis methyl-accepting protein methylase
MTEARGDRALEDAGRLLSRRVGLRLDPAIRGRLARAVRDEAARCGTDDAAYVARLDAEPDLLQDLLNRVTVQETSFFRDPGQFAALASYLLPALQSARRPVRVWSAGCANGQEAYSLAMTFAESGVADWQVLATDISTDALERTRAATYKERELRGLSVDRRTRFLEPVGSEWRVHPALRERVTLTRHNLAADPPPFEPGGCQIEFCRNVLIYFQHDDVVAFLDRLAARLPPAAHLFLGYSESLWQVSDRFQLVRLGDAFVYQLASAAVASPRPEARAPVPQPLPPPVPRMERRAPPPAPPRAPRGTAPSPQTSVELMAEGEAALGRGDAATAIAAFRKAVFIDPDHPVAHLNLGLALEVAGADSAARRAYAAARAALDRCDTAAVETTLEGYHLDDFVRLLDGKATSG